MAYQRKKNPQAWQNLMLTEQWDVKGSGGAGATATKTTAGAGFRHLITEILVNSSAASVVQIKSGSTVRWEFDLPANTVVPIEMSGCPIRCNPNEDAVVNVSTGTAKVNISGVTIKDP
ncbi:MAG: hypothetical protein AABY07_00285 [Nanoarchaeota archaeon]